MKQILQSLLTRGRRCCKRIARIGYVGLWVCVALLLLSMTRLTTRILAFSLEREWLVDGRVPSVEFYPTADAIVLLGGGIMHQATNLTAYAEMGPSADRVWQAARLYKAGKAQRILVTGDVDASVPQGLLADFGIPKEALAFVENVRNTEEEAKEIAKRGVKSILLVTSAWQMRRAMMTFEKYAKGVGVVPAPTDFEATAYLSEGFGVKDFVPNAEAMAINSNYLLELIRCFWCKCFR